MVRSRSLRILGVALALVLAACNGDNSGEEATTTTTTLVVTTTTTTTLDTASTTTTTGAVPAPPEYEIVRRIPGDDGDTLVVLLDPSSYSVLTDIDLQNVVADVVERFPPVLRAYIVDSPDAVELVLVEEPTPQEQAVLDEHALVSLEEGFRVVFTGPFGDFGELILGS